jgi:hypothetical protein
MTIERDRAIEIERERKGGMRGKSLALFRILIKAAGWVG